MSLIDKKEAFGNPLKRTALRIFWGQLRKEDRDLPDNDKIKFLKKFPFFQSLNKRQLNEISQLVYERQYQENENLFTVGQPGAALFFIQSGEISIEIHSEDGEAHQLAQLGKYAFVGELALLDESPRSATARAVTPAIVYAFFKTDLDKLLETDPYIAAHVYKSLATIVGARLKATNELIEKKSKAAA